MRYVLIYTDMCTDFIDAAAEKLKQLQVDDHFMVIPEEEKPMPYTDEVFKEAAIQWLIETDQVPFCYLFETHL